MSKKKYSQIINHFARATGRDPKEVKTAFKGRKGALRDHWDHKESSVALGVGAATLTTTFGGLSGTLIFGPLAFIPAILIGGCCIYAGVKKASKIDMEVERDIKKYLAAPSKVKKLPAPSEPQEPPPIKMT